MKKHLLGLAIFSFIFASFAVAFAFLYAPMEITEVKEEIRMPVFENDTRYRCNKKLESIRFEVISTQIDLDKKKLISQIKMKLDRYTNVPKNVRIGTNLFTEQQLEVKNFEIKEAKLENFEIRKDTNEAIFDVISDLSGNRELNRKENLYVKFSIYTNYENRLDLKEFSTEVKPVLFVHGNNSVIKK